MTAFARALGALHADANLSIACTWTTGPARDPVGPVAFRGVQSQPQEQAFGAGLIGATTTRRFLDALVSALPAEPMREDRITIGAEAFLVETVERDAEGLTWRLVLSETE